MPFSKNISTHTTWLRSEPLAQTTFGQSCCTVDHVSGAIQSIQLPRFQAPKRWSLSLLPTSTFPVPKDHPGVYCLYALLTGVQMSCIQEPTLHEAIEGIQHLQGPIHLRPTRLPLILEMLMSCSHFSVLWVSKFTTMNRTFDHHNHLRHQPVSTHKAPHFYCRDRTPLIAMVFSSISLHPVVQLGYGPARFNAHSLRIGSAGTA